MAHLVFFYLLTFVVLVLDLDMTHNGEECTKKCGVEKKHWGLDWCWTVSENEKWHYCTPGNHRLTIVQWFPHDKAKKLALIF